jgi:hypothetical protein
MKKLHLGILIGILLPVLAFVIYYRVESNGLLSAWGYFKMLLKLDKIVTLACLTALPNLALLIYFYAKKKAAVAGGIAIGTAAVAVFEFLVYFL